jgi:hypothetical protein
MDDRITEHLKRLNKYYLCWSEGRATATYRNNL